MKEVKLKKCFWHLRDIENMCDCERVYFDIMIDFEQIRLFICKDYYVQKIRNILEGVDKEIQTNHYINNEFKYAQEAFIEFIINNEFNQPILNKISTYRDRYNKFSVNICVCERPFISVEIDIFKYLELLYNDGIRVNCPS